MKRTLLVLGMVLALAMTAMASADYPDAGITSPTAGEVIYENTLELAGFNNDTDVEDVTWAVRNADRSTDPGCSSQTDVAGNVRGNDDLYAWDGTSFSASVSITDWDADAYCFVLSGFGGLRLVQWFHIVDDYAKVGGVVDANGETVGNGTHAMEGVVGLIGSTPVGEIVVNYRALGDTCTLTPQANLSIGDTAPGIGENQPVRANGTFDNSCGGTADVWILGRGGSLEAYSDRGAITILDAGQYIIDIDLDSRVPADNWVPMLKGNNIVGTR